MLIKGVLLGIVAASLLCGCGRIPYRSDGFAQGKSDCAKLYEENDDISHRNRKVAATTVDNPCWLRSVEERSNYDLMFMEFDDQGWAQESKGDPAKSQDYFDDFFGKFGEIYDANRKDGVSVVVFVHGWHHNADARDANVTSFRYLLRDLAFAEKAIHDEKDGTAKPRRVIGIYIGWRGESITMPWVRELTFWERKNTAERVAQGSILEFFSRMDMIRDRARTRLSYAEINRRDHNEETGGERNVRMLTIGHSFGGLITYEALGGELVRIATRSREDDYVSRLGDLVFIVNPAFEGTRFEPLRLAARRLKSFQANQLPVLVVATSKADWATGKAFPAARWFNTIFENTPGAQSDALVKAVGHNPRYITHELASCANDDSDCAAVCSRDETKGRESTSENEAGIRRDIRHEKALMKMISKDGFRKKEYLCGGMVLSGTKNWSPEGNPFWVVSTTKDFMKDHNDIFNTRFVSFIRQMYLGVIEARK